MSIKAVFVSLGLAVGTALAQPPEKAVLKKIDPAQPAAQDAAMKAWMAAATPNENHKRLEPFVGVWDADVTATMDPARPAEHTKGETTQRWVLDGRFLLQEHSGTMMNMPFKGLGLWGYDNVEKQYVGLWSDTMTTGYMSSAGQYDEKTKSWTMLGSYKDPAGQTWKTREVITVVSNDKNTFDFFQTGPDGKESKAMSVVYTRKATPKYEITPIEIKPKPAGDPGKK